MAEPREKGPAERHYDAVMSAHNHVLQFSHGFTMAGDHYVHEDMGEFSLMAALAYLAIKEVQFNDRCNEHYCNETRGDAIDAKEKTDAGQ